MRQGRRIQALALAAVAGALLAFAPATSAKIFWANQNALFQGFTRFGSVGVANTDGTGANQNLAGVQDGPCAVATDGQYVYWGSRNTESIGRASVSGDQIDSKFITGIEFHCTQIAVDSRHIYWDQGGQGPTAIARANLDGTGVDTSWLPTKGIPVGLAMDADHLYWAWRPAGSGVGRIGRAGVDGTGVDDNFITAGNAFYLAVNSAHIYSVNFGGGYMLRANLDGTAVDDNFLAVRSACGLAADESHLYWGTLQDRIARANADGTGVNTSFISDAQHTCGVAVGPSTGPSPPPPGDLVLGRVKIHERLGTATLFARVREPGRLLLTGKGLQTKLRAPLRARRVRLPIKPRDAKKRLLERNGSVKVRAKVVFQPNCGCRESERRAIRLKRSATS